MYKRKISSNSEDDISSHYTDSDDDSEYSIDSDDSENEDFDLSQNIDIPWCSNGISRPSFEFTNKTGIQVENLNKNNLLDIFECFFTDDLVNIIVTETNRYANQFIAHNSDIKDNSRTKEWVGTNPKEIKTL